MAASVIVISKRPDSSALFDLWTADAQADHLGPDEALGVTACLLYGLSPPYLRSEEARIAWAIHQKEMDARMATEREQERIAAEDARKTEISQIQKDAVEAYKRQLKKEYRLVRRTK